MCLLLSVAMVSLSLSLSLGFDFAAFFWFLSYYYCAYALQHNSFIAEAYKCYRAVCVCVFFFLPFFVHMFMCNKAPHLPATPVNAHLWFVHLFSNSSFCAVCFGLLVSFVRSFFHLYALSSLSRLKNLIIEIVY